VLKDMVSDEECTVFLGFTANLIATGLRGLIAKLVERGFVDVIVTTGGAVDHDVARARGGEYFKGEFELDDEMLRQLDIHRLGNVLVPLESYGPIIEGFVHEVLDDLTREKEEWTPSELLREMGRRLNDPNSFLYKAAMRGVPVFSPGIVDSAVGTALLTYSDVLRSRGGGFKLDVLGDMRAIADIVYSSKKLGALILGGGITKHHIIWWAQFKGGLDYAVYICTAVEWDGSLSGARTREAISWGKIKPKARHVTVPADATIVFPLIALPLLGESIDRRRRSR